MSLRIEALKTGLAFLNDLQGDGWHLAFANSIATTSRVSGTPVASTSEIEVYLPSDAYGVAAIYDNCYAFTPSATGGGSVTPCGETPYLNPITVKAGLSTHETYPNAANTDFSVGMSFSGANRAVIAGGASARAEVKRFSKAGSRLFLKTSLSCVMPAALAAPTVTPGTAGSLNAGNRYVSVTVVGQSEQQSPGSPSTLATTTGSTGSITVTSPGAVAGMIGYRVWVSVLGAAVGDPLYDSGLGLLPFGTDALFKLDPNAAVLLATPRVLASDVQSYPVGGIVMGGVAAGAANTGEWSAQGVDYSEDVRSVSGARTVSVYGPRAVLYYNPLIHPITVAIVGDSQHVGDGDQGHAAGRGGAAVRACSNTAGVIGYSNAAPLYPYVMLACSGETAATYAGKGFNRRWQLALLASTMLEFYGVNDFANDIRAPAIVKSLLTRILMWPSEKPYLRRPFRPKTNTTDGWSSLANQSYASVRQEAVRRQLNVWNFAPTANYPVTAEAMMRCPTGSQPATTNFYSGGDGATTTYLTRSIFVVGSEAVTVGGVAKAAGSDYTYDGQLTLYGVSYAGGIVLAVAPAAAAPVLATYTAMKGLTGWAANARCINTATSGVEVNAAGVAQRNGGLWAPDLATPSISGALTSGSTTVVINDTTKAWTQDQLRGYVLRMTSGAASGLQASIALNTPTQITLGKALGATPTTGDTYVITQSRTQEGTHGTAFSEMVDAPIIAAALAG